MSLMIASGVSRIKYYFVKIGATILSQLTAMFLILVVPFFTFFIFNQEIIIKMFESLDLTVHSADLFIGLLSNVLSLIALMVTMALAVILTRGKTSGLFVYLALSFASRIVQATLIGFFLALLSTDSFETSLNLISSNNIFSLGYHIVEILVFGSIGIFSLRKQDL